MDPLSITATCVGLVSTITKTTLVVGGFVKDVRAARSDLDEVSRELGSLKTVLELLADDINESSNVSFPQTLHNQIAGIVTNCTSVVVEIEVTLKKHEGGKLAKAAQWVAFGKSDVLKLRSSLEAHKSALEIALDMVSLTIAREIKADTQEILGDTSEIKQNTELILAEIARLQQQLPRDADRLNTSGYMLERYLDNLTSYAETVCDTMSTSIDDFGSDEDRTINQEKDSCPISQSGSSDDNAAEHLREPRSGDLDELNAYSDDLQPFQTIESQRIDKFRPVKAEEQLYHRKEFITLEVREKTTHAESTQQSEQEPSHRHTKGADTMKVLPKHAPNGCQISPAPKALSPRPEPGQAYQPPTKFPHAGGQEVSNSLGLPRSDSTTAGQMRSSPLPTSSLMAHASHVSWIQRPKTQNENTRKVGESESQNQNNH